MIFNSARVSGNTARTHKKGRDFVHHRPDTLSVILAVARAQDCAPATKIVMRRTMHDRCVHEMQERDDPFATISEVAGISVEVDESIPMFPGFQIHREVWEL